MAYSLAQAATLAGGTVYGPDAHREVRLWAYDSRITVPKPGTCFLALPGSTRHGAAFIPELVARNVSLFCINSALDRRHLPQGATYWVVENVLRALQRLAAAHRQQYTGTLIAITGSNGKTIVKEWTFALVGGLAAGIYRSPGSYNSQLGVALSLLALPLTSKIALLEVGVSRSGEMRRLRTMVAPDVGLLTNIGDAHDAGFTSRTHKAQEKWSLFASAKTVLVDDTTREAFGLAPHFDEQTLSIRPANEADYLKNVGFDSIPKDAASRQNLTSAVLLAQTLGVEAHELLHRAAALPAPRLRLSVSPGRDGLRIVDDSYTNDYQGLVAALEFFSQHRAAQGQRLAVLGPFGAETVLDHEHLTALASQFDAAELDRLFYIGTSDDPIARAAKLSRAETQVLPDSAAVAEQLAHLSLSNTSILLKGPRRYGLDALARQLRLKSHEVRLEINLEALAHNIAAFRARLRPDTQLCIMVKAGAYGSGSFDIARFFEERGADYLAVANVDEAVELRLGGTQLPILVGNAAPEHHALLHRHRLEPEVTTLRQLQAFADLPLHLKLDSGMHRLGFDNVGEPAAFADLLLLLKQHQPRVLSVFSHLSAAGQPTADEFSRKQAVRFVSAAQAIDEALGYAPKRHLLNSAGTWRFPEWHFDMVRLGIGVYGIGLEHLAPAAFQPAHRLVAQLIQVRNVAAGEVVGYNLGGIAHHDRRIGIVNIGYADGLRRQAGNGRYSVHVAGQRVPTVGSICMDFSMIDLTTVAEASEGDEVEIFGVHQSVTALAACFDTIPYEVFTGIGPRVRRVYYR